MLDKNKYYMGPQYLVVSAQSAPQPKLICKVGKVVGHRIVVQCGCVGKRGARSLLGKDG